MSEQQKFFSTQQIIFLEIHLAISSMCDRISSLHGINLGKVVEDSEDICKIKQLKQILREQEEFSLLRYLMHFESLKDDQKECLNMKITAQEPLLDANCRAYVHVPEVQNLSVKAPSNLKFGPFEFYGVSTQADGKNMEVKSASDKEFRWFSNSLYMFYPLKKQLSIGFGAPSMSSFG
jgi:hypothetical protein